MMSYLLYSVASNVPHKIIEVGWFECSISREPKTDVIDTLWILTNILKKRKLFLRKEYYGIRMDHTNEFINSYDNNNKAK